MHPGKAGPGVFPRFGGGWMHQFGHVYALQQELLNPTTNDWFRAMELWHTAREEGIALNAAHYSNMLRQCVQPAAWNAAVSILNQMKRENIRPDVVGVGCAMAACVEASKPREVELLFERFSKVMLLDSICYLALMRSRMQRSNFEGTINAGRQQAEAKVPYSPNTIQILLEASCAVKNDAYVEELLCIAHRSRIPLTKKAVLILEEIGASSKSEAISRYLEDHHHTKCSSSFKLTEV